MANDEFQKILEERRQIRARERAYRRQTTNKGENMNILEQLKQLLPPNLVPGNVGDIDKVTWQFFFPLTFDFGINPTYTSGTRQVQSFQVSNEAAFLLMAIGRKAWDDSIAGDASPLQVEIRDRQSSRQFNDRPIPLQMIGKKSRKTILPTPMLIAPNAFIDATITSWVTSDMPTVGNGKHELSFFGYRIRGEDMNKMYSSVFG